MDTHKLCKQKSKYLLLVQCTTIVTYNAYLNLENQSFNTTNKYSGSTTYIYIYYPYKDGDSFFDAA